jgi:hypothetical protein
MGLWEVLNKAKGGVWEVFPGLKILRSSPVGISAALRFFSPILPETTPILPETTPILPETTPILPETTPISPQVTSFFNR